MQYSNKQTIPQNKFVLPLFNLASPITITITISLIIPSQPHQTLPKNSLTTPIYFTL